MLGTSNETNCGAHSQDCGPHSQEMETLQSDVEQWLGGLEDMPDEERPRVREIFKKIGFTNLRQVQKHAKKILGKLKEEPNQLVEVAMWSLTEALELLEVPQPHNAYALVLARLK